VGGRRCRPVLAPLLYGAVAYHNTKLGYGRDGMNNPPPRYRDLPSTRGPRIAVQNRSATSPSSPVTPRATSMVTCGFGSPQRRHSALISSSSAALAVVPFVCRFAAYGGRLIQVLEIAKLGSVAPLMGRPRNLRSPLLPARSSEPPTRRSRYRQRPPQQNEMGRSASHRGPSTPGESALGNSSRSGTRSRSKRCGTCGSISGGSIPSSGRAYLRRPVPICAEQRAARWAE
jgi:hypothetical protein